MPTRSTMVSGLMLVLVFTFLTACASSTQSGNVQSRAESNGQAVAAGPQPTAGQRDLDLNALHSDTDAYLADREVLRFVYEDVYFDYDSADLKPAAVAELMRKAQWLKHHPEALIVIEGHCDERGSNDHNLGLGEKRAGAIKSFLIRQGIDQRRMTTISYGEERPVDQGHNEEAWAKNRRVHVTFP